MILHRVPRSLAPFDRSTSTSLLLSSKRASLDFEESGFATWRQSYIGRGQARNRRLAAFEDCEEQPVHLRRHGRQTTERHVIEVTRGGGQSRWGHQRCGCREACNVLSSKVPTEHRAVNA